MQYDVDEESLSVLSVRTCRISAVVEHALSKRKVGGSKPPFGFHIVRFSNVRKSIKTYQGPGLNRRPSACKADVITTTPP